MDKTKEPQVEEGDAQKTLGESINFFGLYSIMGKDGVWIRQTVANKGGMSVFDRFMQYGQRRVAHNKQLTHFHDLVFYKELGLEPLKIGDVLDNIHACIEEKSEVWLEQCTIEEQMEVMVPNYDKTRFMPGHAKKAMKWCMEIIKRLKDAESDKESDREAGVSE